MSYGKVNKSTGERIPYAGSAAAITPSAEYIDYDNTDSGMTADNVQDAIDESYGAFSELCLCVVNGRVCQRVRKEV